MLSGALPSRVAAARAPPFFAFGDFSASATCTAQRYVRAVTSTSTQRHRSGAAMLRRCVRALGTAVGPAAARVRGGTQARSRRDERHWRAAVGSPGSGRRRMPHVRQLEATAMSAPTLARDRGTLARAARRRRRGDLDRHRVHSSGFCRCSARIVSMRARRPAPRLGAQPLLDSWGRPSGHATRSGDCHVRNEPPSSAKTQLICDDEWAGQVSNLRPWD